MSVLMSTPELKKTIPLGLIIIFLFFSFGIVIMGRLYYKFQSHQIISEQEQTLEAVATLKKGQIEQWHSERLGDATTIRDNQPLVKSIKQFFESPNQVGIQNELTKWMDTFVKSFDYDGISVVDTMFRTRLTVTSADSVSITRIKKDLSDAIKTRSIIMTDMHRAESKRDIHIDLLIPLVESETNNKVVFGVMVLRINPGKILFPLIQFWPTPSKSSETLIVEKEGDSIVYLNELRHIQNTALNLRLPLIVENLPASKAVNGFTGIFEGIDYRNIPVVSYLTPITKLPWFMVTKVDKEELLARMKKHRNISVILTILLILVNASVFVYWVRQQRIKLYKNQLLNEIQRKKADEKLRESEELYRNLFDNMLNGFAYCKMLYEDNRPSDFVYITVNKAFESLTGLKNVIGKKVSEIIPGITRSDPELIKRYGRVALTGNPEVFETYLEALKMWFSVSVYSPQKEYFVAVFDVITERKLAEEKLRETNEYLSNLINYANAPIIVWDTSLFITRFNHAFETLSGYSAEEVISKRIDILFSEEKTAYSLDLIRRAASGERWETVEIEIQRKDKDSRIVLWNSANIFEKDGTTLIATIAQGYDITERKIIEKALAESEDKFKYVFDHSVTGKSITLPTGEINVNAAFSEMIGYTPAELTKTKWQDITHPDDIELTQKMIDSLLSGEKKSVRSIKRYIHKNGSVVWADVGTVVRRNSEGEPQYLITSVLDITERKKAEEALLIQKRIGDIFLIFPDDEMYFEVLKIVLELMQSHFGVFGYIDLEGALIVPTMTRHIWDKCNIPEKTVKFPRETWGNSSWPRAIREKKPNYTNEVSTITPKGHVILARHISFPILFQGEVIGLFQVANKETDYTEEDINKLHSISSYIAPILYARLHNEWTQKSMSSLAIRQEAILSAVSDIIMEVDNNKVYTWANKAGYEFFGDDVLGKEASYYFEGEQSTYYLVKPLFEGNENKIYLESWQRRKDGEKRLLAWWCRVLKNSNGEISGALSSALDITERVIAESKIKKLNEELEQRVIQRTEQLEAANKELEAFSYSVSHDLRAPLRAVHGYTNILLEDYKNTLDDEGKRLCGVISSSATRMGELIDDLLSFSRIGRSSLNYSLLDMKSLAGEVFVNSTDERVKQRTNLTIGRLHKSYGDINLIRQVWNNLISNALKYSSKKEFSEISIGSQVDGNTVNYFIKDNGVGFDMNYKHKLYGVFQRLHSETEFEGNGVGLAIVQRIILKHGGKVWAEGEIDKGAIFYFSLPMTLNDELLFNKK